MGASPDGSLRETAAVRGQTAWAWKVGLYLGLSSAAAGAELTWQVGRGMDATWGDTARPGVALGLALALLGALFILLDLGRWPRFYRAVSRPSTAWIARGFLLLMAFDLLGLVQMARPASTSDGWELLLSALAGLLALALLAYGGLLLHSARPFPLWRHPLQIALFPASGLLAGCGLLALDPTGLMSPAQLRALGVFGALLTILVAALLTVFLLGVRGSAPAGLASVEALVRGTASRHFWLGAVGLGLALPLLLWVGASAGAVGAELVRPAGGSALLGLLFLRYATLAAARRSTGLSFRGLGPWGVAS